MSDFALPGANAFLNGTALPTTLYVKGHLGNPGPSGLNNAAAEADRIAIDSWTTSTTGTKTNTQVESILNAAADETWSHLSYWDDPTAGICWFIDDIANVAVQQFDTVQLDIANAVIAVTVWA